MNGLILSENLNNQDIKLSKEKKSYLKSQNGKDDFDNLISNLLKTDDIEEKSDFLLSKLLSSAQNFEKEEKIVSSFSQGELLSEKDIQKVTLEDMIKLSFLVKNGVNITDFQTDSKMLKEALTSKEFITELKETKDIKSLINLAEKFDIKVKNFEFFKEENALLPEDKKAVRKITSEEVFTLIDKKLTKEDKENLISQINKKDKIQNSELKTPILEQLLSKKSEKKLIKDPLVKEDVKQEFSKNTTIEKEEKKTPNRVSNENQKVIKKENLTTQKIETNDSSTPKAIPTASENRHPKTIIKEEKVVQKEQLHIKQSSLSDEKVVQTVVNKTLQSDTKVIKSVLKEQLSLEKTVEVQNKKLSTNTEITDTIQKELVGKKEQIKTQNIEVLKKSDTPTTKDLLQNVLKSKESINTKELLPNKEQEHSTTQKNIVKPVTTQSFSKIQTDINFKTLKQEQQITNIQTIKTQTKDTQPSVSRESKIENDIPHEKTVINHEPKVTQIDREKQPVEVKKTFSTFAQEFKEKVESYKAPLMKVKMQLNPMNLGEVDVTLLNRGKNLHVNVSSNSANMAIFMQNQAEFRNSLVNMGFTNLQMNFSENSKQEQNKQENSKNSNKNNFRHDDNSEENESIDIVMPYYI